MARGTVDGGGVVGEFFGAFYDGAIGGVGDGDDFGVVGGDDDLVDCCCGLGGVDGPLDAGLPDNDGVVFAGETF